MKKKYFAVVYMLVSTAAPGACIIKLITAVIYSFRNKLEYLSLVSLSCLMFRDKHSSLSWKPYITAVISFMIQAPGAADDTSIYTMMKIFFFMNSLFYALSM